MLNFYFYMECNVQWRYNKVQTFESKLWLLNGEEMVRTLGDEGISLQVCSAKIVLKTVIRKNRKNYSKIGTNCTIIN